MLLSDVWGFDITSLKAHLQSLTQDTHKMCFHVKLRVDASYFPSQKTLKGMSLEMNGSELLN